MFRALALCLVSSIAAAQTQFGGVDLTEDKNPPPKSDVQVSPASQPVITPSSGITSGQAWSVVGARTIGVDDNLVEAGVGYPGIHVSYLRGVLDKMNLGVRLSFNYGVEGVLSRIHAWAPISPGLKVQGLFHYRLLEQGKVSMALRFEPGPLFHFERGYTLVGFALPISFRVGIAAASAIGVGIGFDIPLWVQFSSPLSSFSVLVVPILMGGGLEYFISSNLLVSFNLRMGPSIPTNGSNAAFTFEGKLGVGYRF